MKYNEKAKGWGMSIGLYKASFMTDSTVRVINRPGVTAVSDPDLPN